MKSAESYNDISYFTVLAARRNTDFTRFEIQRPVKFNETSMLHIFQKQIREKSKLSREYSIE